MPALRDLSQQVDHALELAGARDDSRTAQLVRDVFERLAAAVPLELDNDLAALLQRIDEPDYATRTEG
jgi:hypothetical protein